MNIEKAMAKAVHDYSMIQDGDKILIGASGGKDSLALSWLLSRMAARGRPAFTLGALKVVIAPDVTEGLYKPQMDALTIGSSGGSGDGVDECTGNSLEANSESNPPDRLARLYTDWGIPLMYYGIRARMDTVAAPNNPPEELITGCYRCSSLRREALANYAKNEGYGAIALGHHLDDLLTTALMNLVIHGGGAAMKPSRAYDKLGLCLIRPLAYVPEESIRRLAAKMGWDSLTCTCPSGTAGDRAEFRRRLEVLCGGRLEAKLKLLKGLGMAKA